MIILTNVIETYEGEISIKLLEKLLSHFSNVTKIKIANHTLMSDKDVEDVQDLFKAYPNCKKIRSQNEAVYWIDANTIEYESYFSGKKIVNTLIKAYRDSTLYLCDDEEADGPLDLAILCDFLTTFNLLNTRWLENISKIRLQHQDVASNATFIRDHILKIFEGHLCLDFCDNNNDQKDLEALFTNWIGNIKVTKLSCISLSLSINAFMGFMLSLPEIFFHGNITQIDLILQSQRRPISAPAVSIEDTSLVREHYDIYRKYDKNGEWMLSLCLGYNEIDDNREGKIIRKKSTNQYYRFTRKN